MKKILFLLLSLPVLAAAQIPDFKPNTYVNDFTSTLTDQQIRLLNDSIYSIEKRTSVQIAVVLIDSLPENMSIEEYAMGIGRKWHVGNAANGLVYVAALQQRKQRLEVARHLEGDIPDIVALELTNNIKTYFRNKDYFGGLMNLLKDINERVDPVAKEQLKLAEEESAKKSERFNHIALNIFLWLLGLSIVGIVLYRLIVVPRIIKREKLEEEREKKKNDVPITPISIPVAASIASVLAAQRQRRRAEYTPPPTYDPPPSRRNDDDDYKPSRKSDDDNFGNWGSGSSDNSSSSDSGFSGGGATNDW